MILQKTLPPDRVWTAAWHTPLIETTPADDGDGNINGQSFDLSPAPVLPRAGRCSNLGQFHVNNDQTHLYLGFEHVMIYPGSSLFLFLQSPRLPGVTTLRGLGNGQIDPAGQGVDGLDCLENLSFAEFTPAIACILGDECADALFRSCLAPGSTLNTGQGVFQLNPSLDDVPGTRLQQFNRSPQLLTATEGVQSEQHADFIEVAIPFSALGQVQPGDIIQLAALVGTSAFDPIAQTRSLDSAVLGSSLTGAGQEPVTLGAIRVRLAFPPDLDTDQDGLPDNWELAHDLDQASAAGDDGAEGDPDGDRSLNSEELLAGTDPRDPASALRATLTVLGPELYRLQWPAVPGLRYSLSIADNQLTNSVPLVAPGWPRLALALEEDHVDDLSANPPMPQSRFYRIRVER